MQLSKLAPQLAVLAAHPPQGNQWIHEIKFDGYRILAFIEGGRVKLHTRNGHDWTHKFPAVAEAAKKLKVDTAVIDGELVLLDAQGRSDFQALQALLKGKTRAEPVFFAFDLPFCDGEDLRSSPLIERKLRLKKVLQRSRVAPRIAYSDHFQTPGDELLDHACRLSLEGIISKRMDAAYVSRRDPSWLKSKCNQRQEFVVIGFTAPQGARTGFGALLLGYHDDQHRLTYAGRVGTGFNEKLLGDLYKQLKQLEIEHPPTANVLPTRERRAAHWIKPRLVAEVRFTGWTRDGMLRHPAFIALRSDKAPADIVRETPIELPMKARKLKSSPTAKASPRNTNRNKTTSNRSGMTTARSPEPRIPNNGRRIVGTVSLSHPDKLLYAQPKVTKLDLAGYYEVVGKWMLPHVVDRPLALVRCPNGQAGKCFFQRNWSDTLPDDVGSADVGMGGKKELHVAVHDLAGVISLVQIGVLEIHTWNCKAGKVEHPDQLVFDLDPGPDVPWKRVIESARVLHRTLDKFKLPQFLKTSGGKGLHITIPIRPTVDWDSAKRFCETIAKALADSSDMFVANMRKDLRGGKVYIDYQRNGRGATAVAPYSTRARAGAAVSMPISWEELGKLKSAAHFTVETAGQYLKKRKSDPWRAFDKSRIDLRKLVRGKAVA